MPELNGRTKWAKVENSLNTPTQRCLSVRIIRPGENMQEKPTTDTSDSQSSTKQTGQSSAGDIREEIMFELAEPNVTNKPTSTRPIGL